MSRETASKPAPHPAFATLAISAMALVVAAMLEVLGLLQAVDGAVADHATGVVPEDTLTAPGRIWVWSWTVVITTGVAWSVLHARFPWQRWVIIVSALVLTLGWWPVLVLMGVAPALAVPMIAYLWVVVAAMIYAGRHASPDTVT